MPKRTDIHTILVIGSGPIVIGQACEFDYSGTQACKALREEGYRVVLVNSNPATIMTDPEMADQTYVEPLTVPVVERIIAHERPDAILSTVGGQTGLNLSSDLAEQGILERYGVELIGANWDAIRVAEDREMFKEAMIEIGLEDCQCPDGLWRGAVLRIGPNDIASWSRHADPDYWYQHWIALSLTPEKKAEMTKAEGPMAVHCGFRLLVGEDSHCGELTFVGSAAAVNGWVFSASWNDETYLLGYDLSEHGPVNAEDLLDEATVVDILDRVESIMSQEVSP